MEEIVDFEYLLRPITQPVDSPRILRFEIRSRRNAENEKEEREKKYKLYGPEHGEQKAPEPADWSGFIRECETHLANKVKDLWVCAWYTEALLIRHGFGGLAAGLELSRKMIEQHWDVIEPSPNAEDGVEDTVKMFAGLNSGSTFIDRLEMTPISEVSGDLPALAYATMDEVDEGERAALIAATGEDFRQQLGDGIRESISKFDELCEIFKEKCGADAPPSARVRETLASCQKKIFELYPSLVPTEPVDEAPPSETGLVENNGTRTGILGSSTSHIQNREEAFKLLERVSKFFRENEPSSPVSYALIQAVRWGRMSLPDLINDLVDDHDARSQILRMTGIKRGNEGGGSGDAGAEE